MSYYFKTWQSVAGSMCSLLNASINCHPIFDGTNFPLWKLDESFIRSIDFDFWDIISNGPVVSNRRRDDGSTVIKLKSEYTQDDYGMLKKNSRVLYILQCALNDKIFNHICYCETVKDLQEKLTLLYKETSQENPNSSRRDNMLSNMSDEK